MAKIKYEIIGNSNFLRAAEYGSHIYGCFKDYESKFKIAENVFIRLEENINPNVIVQNDVTVSEDGKSINLIYKISRYFQPKGGLSKPSVSEFFSDLQHYLDNVILVGDHYRFEKLNDTPKE